MSARVLQLDPGDNVLIALTDRQPGEPVAFQGQSDTPVVKVPAKHKFATRRLELGDNVMMYGVVVGKATRPIAAGELLTISNVQHQASPFREQ